MRTNFNFLNCNKNTKVNYLHNDIYGFPENLNDFSKEEEKEEERFHQEMITMKIHIKKDGNNQMTAYYCRTLQQDCSGKFCANILQINTFK